MKALQVGTDDVDQVALPRPGPGLEEQKTGQETVLEAVVYLDRLLPVGWSAEVRPGSVVLSWRTG
jgi:hypothetical protein